MAQEIAIRYNEVSIRGNMKIDDHILNLSPYITCTWDQVAALRTEQRLAGPVLLVDLKNDTKAEVPGLDLSILAQIFDAYSKFLEKNTAAPLLPFPLINGIENLATTFQHNPAQAEMPNLPPELLSRISEMTKHLGVEDSNLLPKAEPHCNCPFCQIARTIQGDAAPAALEIEEVVTDEDLRFRTWDIKQDAEKLFTVASPLAPEEHYSVFLGDPVCCTCGAKNCEHIQAVLRS